MYELVGTIKEISYFATAFVPFGYYFYLTCRNQGNQPPISATAPSFCTILTLSFLLYLTHSGMEPESSLSVAEFSSQILPMFLVQFVSFQLFYFNVPYRSGEELRELSENRIYKSIYYLMAGMGRGCSRIIDHLTINRNGSPSGWNKVSNLLVYVLAVFFTTELYHGMSLFLLNIEPNNFTLRGNFLDMYYNFQLLYAIVSAFQEVTGIITFIQALSQCALYIIYFQCLSIFYFTFIYGLLESSLHNLVNRGGFSPVCTAQPYTFGSLLYLLKETLKNFVGNLSYMVVLLDWKVLIPFSLATTVFGMMQLLQGSTVEVGGLLYQILEASNLIHVLISFIVATIFVKTSDYVGHAVYLQLPPSMKSQVDAFGDRLEEYEEEVRRRNAESRYGDAISQLRDRVHEMRFR